MNRNQASSIVKHIDMVKAFAEGKVIQFKNYEGEWVDTANPAFLPNYEYRIKPNRKVRVGLCNDECTPVIIAWTPGWAKQVESQSNFVRWITDWISYAACQGERKEGRGKGDII